MFASQPPLSGTTILPGITSHPGSNPLPPRLAATTLVVELLNLLHVSFLPPGLAVVVVVVGGGDEHDDWYNEQLTLSV